MANVLGTRQLKIDTAGAAVLLYDLLDIRDFQFVDYDADTDEVEVYDASDNLVWHGNGHSDLSPVSAGGAVGLVQGLKVTVLNAGKLLVYLR